jgi:D-erythronate 2-dehydrogenase
MHLLITGANGFIGKALVARLLDSDSLPWANQHITALDLAFDEPEGARLRRLAGSMADPALIAQVFEDPVDVIFHLASIPGGTAEQDYDLGRKINLDATLLLLEAARAQRKAPIFVFASSIAVLGGPLPPLVDDTTPMRPKLSYGAHKLIGEVLAEDFSRHGWIDGRSLRLPGIVARPPRRTGQLSAYMSDIIRELAAGNRYECPVSASSTAWLMSTPRVIDNLLHAATLPAERCIERRTWTLPALHCSMLELVEAIGGAYGTAASELVSWRSDPALEATFGRYPPLRTAAADSVGFRHDGDLTTLVKCALRASSQN